MKRLIIRADDAGSSRSANNAIFECASRGLVRNVSLMAPGPFIHDSAPEGNWLFITHPAFDDAEMRSVGAADVEPGQVARERDADRALLLDESLRAELERRQVLVARYSDVLGQAAL